MTDQEMPNLPFKEVFDADFNRQIAERMKLYRVPGCAIALVPLGNEPIFKTYWQEGSQPITQKTRFPISSITNTVTTLALIHALETAGFSNPFDARIKDILPDFKLSDLQATEQCTVSDILGHRCNISHSDLLLVRPFEKGVNSLIVLADLPMSRPLRDDPPIYSNAVFQLTFALIERLSGEPFEEYVRQVILDPLGMDSTGYWAELAGEDLAVGYQIRHTPQGMDEEVMTVRHGLDNLGAESGMATMRLISNIEDMAKLLACLATHPPFRQISIPSDDPASWVEGEAMRGLGTTSILIGDHLLSGNKGSCTGFRSHLMDIPTLGCGISVMTNSTEGDNLALWIEAWVVGSLTGKRAVVCARMSEKIENNRAQYHLDELSECPTSIVGTGNEKLIGHFYSPTYGALTFTEDCNVAIRPSGEGHDMPWLAHLYGSLRPLITSMGDGKFEGCLEWTAGDDQEQGWGKQYRYPFTLQVGDSGSGGEVNQVRLSGLDWAGDHPAIFYRL